MYISYTYSISRIYIDIIWYLDEYMITKTCILYREHSDAKHSASDTWNGKKRAPEVLTGAEQVFPIATDMRLEASLKQSDSSESCPSQIQHQHKGIDKIAVFRKVGTPLHSSGVPRAAKPKPTNQRHQQSPTVCCDLQRLEKLQHLSADTTVPTSQSLGRKAEAIATKDMMSKPQTQRGFNHPTSPKACRYFLPTTVQRFHDLTFFVSSSRIFMDFEAKNVCVFSVFSVHSILLLKKLLGV